MDNNKQDQFYFFFRSTHPLSNWYLRDFVVKGIKFNCNEQFLMFCKAKLFGDEEIAAKILLATDPKDQKALGRLVKGFKGEIWVTKREQYDYIGALHKFQQNPDLAEFLLATGDLELVEASPYDRIWGVGLDAQSPAILHRRLWRGLNLHGKQTQRVRDTLRQPFPEPVL